MIKGFRFTNQLANAEVDARIHQEFLNKNDGIFYGMEMSKTNNSITISEGLCEIAGRPVAVINNETIAVSTENLYCLLVLEIDLSKETTKDSFSQVTFKLLTSSTDYPTVTQQDINKYNGENNLYQLEFARFKSGTAGITDFKDTRQFLSFDGIYSQIKNDCRNVLAEMTRELAAVEKGSAYILEGTFQYGITIPRRAINDDFVATISFDANRNYMVIAAEIDKGYGWESTDGFYYGVDEMDDIGKQYEFYNLVGYRSQEMFTRFRVNVIDITPKG